jgi:hypothetical protein
MKKSFVLLTLGMMAYASSASGALTGAGDLAFIGFNADGDDDLAFVALSTVAANTTVYFTDNEWNGSAIGSGGAWVDTNESFFTWNSGGSAISAGTVISLSSLSIAGRSASVGTLTGSGSNFGISNGSDTIYAYLGTNVNTPTSFLAAVANHSVDSLVNTGLVDGTTAVLLPDSTDGGEYTGARTGQMAFSGYLSSIGNDATNWSLTSDGASLIPFDSTAFTIPEPSAFLLGGLGLVGLVGLVRRNRRAG